MIVFNNSNNIKHWLFDCGIQDVGDYFANFPFLFKVLKAVPFVFQVCQTLLSDMNVTAQRCGHRRLPECTDVLVKFKRLKIMTDLGIVFVRVSTDFYDSERARWHILKMLENLENMTGRRASFRDYHVLLESSFNLLLLLYLMH